MVVARLANGITRGVVGTKAGEVAEGEAEAEAVVVGHPGVDTMGVVVAVAVAVNTTRLWWPTGMQFYQHGGLCRRKARLRCGKVPTRGPQWWGICPVEQNAEWWAVSRWSTKAKLTRVCM